MRITEFLNESTIKVGMEARNKTVAIEELVDLLVEQHEISMTDRALVIEAILAREKMVSTGMEHGVAIPHGAVDAVDDIVAALGTSSDGVDFQSIDGKKSNIILLLILPAQKYNSSVQTMAGVSRVLSHQSLRDGICKAETPDAIMDIICDEEERQTSSS